MFSGEKNVKKREGLLEREMEPKLGNVGRGCQSHTSPAENFWIGERVGSHIMLYINHSC